MKAAIIGAGAIGGFYGAALADAGMDVSFIARGKTLIACLLYTSPSPRDRTRSRMPSSA